MSNNKGIQIGLIISNRIMREFLGNSINAEPDMAVCYSKAHLNVPLQECDPTVFISRWSDICDMFTGLQTAIFNGRKIIIIDVDVDKMDVIQCIRYHVVGFVMKDSPFTDIVHAIRKVGTGEWVVPAQISTQLYCQVATNAKRALTEAISVDDRITMRERQIIPLVCEGMTNKEIATRLNISVDTVKVHIHNILYKLKLSGRIDLIRCAYSLHI